MTASFEDSYREIDRYLQEAQNELGLAFDDLPADLPPWPDPPDVTKPDPVISESKDTRPKHAVDFEAIFRAHNLIDSNRSMRKKTSSSSGSGGGHHVKRKDENLFGSSSKHSSSKRHHRSRCMSDAGVKTHEQRNNSASSVDASKYRISLNLDFSPRRERIQSAPESRRPENAPDKRKTSTDVKLSRPDIQGSYSSVKPDLISDCDKIYPEASSPPPSGCGRVKNSDSTTTLFRNRDFPQEKETRAYEKVLFDDDDDNDDRAAKKKNSRRRKKSEKVEDHRHPSRKPDISAVFDFIETQIRRNICKDDMGSECEPFLQMEDKNVYAAMSDAADRNSSYQQRASDSNYDEVYAGGDDDLDENDRKVVNNSNDAAHEKMKQHNHVDVLSSPLKHPHDDIKFIDEDDDDDEVKDEASESVDAEFAQKVKLEIENVTVAPDVELRRKTSEPTIDWLALRQKRLSPIFDCEHSDIDSQHYYCIKVNEDNLRKADEKGKKYGHRRSGSLNVDTRANSNVRSKGDCIDDFDVFLSRKTISALETLNKGDNKEPENGVRTEQPQQHAKKKESKLSLLQKRLRKRSAPPSMAAFFRRKNVNKDDTGGTDNKSQSVESPAHGVKSDVDKESVSSRDSSSNRDHAVDRGYMSDHEKEKPKKDHGLFHSLRRSASKRFHRKSPARSVPVVIIHNKNAHEDEQKLVVSPSDESIKLIDSPVVPPPPPPPQPPSADIKDAHRKEKDGKFARLKKRLRKRSAPPSLLTFHRFLTHDKDTGGVLENKGVYNEGVDVSEPSIPAPYQSYPQPPGSASLTRKHKWYDGFRTAPLPRKNSKKNSGKDENKPKDNDTENMVKYGVTPTSCSCHFGQTQSVKAGRGGATRCVGCGHYSNNFAKAHGHQRKYSAPDIKYGQPANKEFLQSPSSHMSQKRLRNMCQPIVPPGVDYSATTLPSKSSQKGYIDMADDNSVCRTVSESGMIGQPFDYSSNTQTFPRIRTSPTHPNESAPVQQQNSLLDSLHRKYYSHQYERKDIKLGTRAYKRSPEQSGKSDSESDSSRVSVAGLISPDTVQRDLSISSTSIGNRSSRESSPGIVNILKVSEGMDKYATSSVTVSACSCPHHLDSDTVSVQSYRSSSSSSNKAGDCADNLPHDHGRRGSVESDSSGLNLSNSLRSNKSSGSNRSRKSFDASSLRVVKPVKLQSFDEMNAAVQRSVTDKRRRRSCDDGGEQLNFSSPPRNKTASTRDGSTSEWSVKTNGSLNRNRPKSCDRDRRNGSRNKRDSSLSNGSSVYSNRESERSSFLGMSSSVQSDNSDVLSSSGNDDQPPSSATSRRIFDELLLVNKELEISSASSFFNDSNDEDGCFNFDRILRDDEDFVGLDDSAVVDADCEFNFEQVFEQRLNAFGEKSNTLKQSDFNLSDFAESGDSSSSSSQSTLCSEPGTVDGRATVDDEKATASLKNAPSSLTMTPSNVHLLSLSSSQTDENSNETMSLDRALIKKNHPIIPSSTMVHHGSVFSLPSNENKRSSDGFISLEDMVRDLKSLMTEKELAEIEAIEACRWLRAAGFPQYAQMYEDQQFPIELGVVEKDHDFLDRDQLQSLFRRLNTLNRCTTMKIDTSSRKAVNDVTQDESDDEDQCALSDKWKFQRSNHRWSRKELEDTPPIPVVVVDSSASQPQPITSCSSHDSVLTDNDSSGHVDDSPKLTPKSLPLMSHLSPGDGLDVGSRLHPDDADDDDLTSPRLRRAASEKIKGAKTFFKRMESLKGNKRKKNNNNGGKQQHISKEGIGSPTLTDVEDMQARIERLNCVDICSADEMSPPLSPSLGQYSSVKAFSDTDCSPVHERYGLNAAAASENTLNPSRSDSESLGSQIRHKRNLSDLAGATGYTDMSREFRIPKVLSNGYIEAGSGSLNYRTGSFNLGSDSAEKDEMLDRVRRRTESTHSQCPREHRVSFYDNVTPDEPDPQKELDKVLEDLFQNINSLANFGGEDGEDSNLNNELATTSKPEESSDDAFTIPGISIDSPEKTSSPIEIKPPRHSHTSEEGIQFDFDQTDESAVFEGDNVESPCSDVQITRHMVVSTTDTSSAPETVSDLESPLSPEDGSEQSTSSARERRDSGVGSSLTRTPSSERRRPRIRWHSFQKSHRPSLGSKNLQISSHSAGQLMVLRKLALLKLTGIMDKYSPSNRTGWSWTMPKFIKRFRAPDYKDKNVFGVPLLVMLQRTVQPLPQCILYAMRHLRRTAPEQVGIFRKSGVRSRIQKLRNQLESNPDMIDFESIQEYDVADLLKQYFRELPECLLTNKFSEIFISIYTYLPPDQRLEACQSAIMLMPDENREVLQSLLLFLSDLAQHSEKNQMNASNLAVCFAPSIFNILRNTDNRSASNSPKRGRKHTGGIPDQKELVEQKAAHECLTQMITECKKFFMIPEDALKKCRFSYIEQGDPSTLEELCKTLSDGKPNYPSYIESCIQGVLKESREKFKGWVSIPSETDVDLSYKKVGDGHPLRLWKCAIDVPAPPIEVLNRVLRERHLWDEDLLKWRIVERLDKETEIFQNVRNSMAPHPTRDYTTLRSWRTDLPKGACCLVATSVEHPEAPLLGGVRAVVLASRYLIEPCGSGKSRITHMCRTDTRGRTPEWYNKAFGHMCATLLLKVRESFKHSTPTHGPETKV